MNGPGERPFKALWRELVKERWKPRNFSGHSSHHSYVKPGVSCGLRADKNGVGYFVGEESLMVYARQAGLFHLPVEVGIPRLSSVQRPRMGKQVAYTSEVQHGALPSAQDKPVPDYTEHVVSDQVYIPDDKEYSDTAKSEVYTKPDERSDTLDDFDGEEFLAALRSEALFEPTASDNINVVEEPILDEYNLEDDESAFEEQGNDFGDYESDIESDPEFEDESVLFEQDDDEMRVLGNSRWDIYDEAHGGKSVLNRIY
ncbi:hypothetical protein PInf_026678 [Phytophthora infestans]|nr:hypothetical protein PInf_026678 [Phytophthora infestans]